MTACSSSRRSATSPAGLVPPGWGETVDTARRRRLDIEGPGAASPVGDWSSDEGTWIGPSGGPITVDRAVPEDADEAARAHTASAEAAYRDVGPADPNGLGRRTTMWREMLADPANQSFVARDNGRIVGVLDIGPFRGDEATGAVHILYVLPMWWGSGAGQALLDRAHEVLAATYDEAILTVLEANARARRFYERNGWRLLEVVVEPHFGGQLTEVARYRRTLRSGSRSG